MARSLIDAVFLLSVAVSLAGCAEMSRLGEGDVFQMHRNAVLAYESGEDARAEALYQGLARIAPNDPETWLRLGNLYARAGRPDDAAEAYQRSLMLAPSDYRVWYNLGVIRQRQAHAAYIRTNELAPESDALYQRSKDLIDHVAPLPRSDKPTPEEKTEKTEKADPAAKATPKPGGGNAR